MTLNRIDWDVLLASKPGGELEVRGLLGRAFLHDALRRAFTGAADPGTRLAMEFCARDENAFRECMRTLLDAPAGPSHDVALSLVGSPPAIPWNCAEGGTWVRRLLADPRGNMRALGLRGLSRLRVVRAAMSTADWREFTAWLQEAKAESDWVERAALAALAPWLEDPEPVVRAAAREEIDRLRAEQEESAASDAPAPILAGGSHFDDHLEPLLVSGQPPVAFGTSIDDAAQDLQAFRREGDRLVLSELALRFGAGGLAEVVIDYSRPLPLAESVLNGTFLHLAPRLTRQEVEARFRRFGRWFRADGEALATRGGARVEFGSEGHLARVVLRAEKARAPARTALPVETPPLRHPVDMLPEVELKPMDAAPVPWLTAWDWDALAAEPGVIDAAGQPSFMAAVRCLLGEERLAQPAPGDLDAVLTEGAILGVLGWKAMERLIPVARFARDGVDRRMAAHALGSSTRSFAAEHGAELAALIDGFIEDPDGGVALFGALKISRKLNDEGVLSDERALADVARLEHHRGQHVRFHATETRRMIEGRPAGLAALFDVTSVEDLAGQGIPPAGLWFPMTAGQANELLGPPDRVDESVHSWRELHLTFDDDGLRRIIIDAGNPLPVGSLLRDWRWFLWGTMTRVEVLAALDENLETMIADPESPGRIRAQELLEDGSVRTAGGAIIRFGYEESLATIEITREAWAVTPARVHWSCTSGDDELPDDD